MWNNGNGNGNGYGGGYSGGADDVYNRMNNAREVGGARFPFIEAGKFKLALGTLEKFQHKSDGPCARALFAVLESNNPAHPVGSWVVKIWKLVKQPKFDSQPSDAEKLADFAMKLKNAPRGYPIGNDIRTLLDGRPAEQLARGSVIEAVGVSNKKGNWVEVYWTAIPQTPQDIVAMRQRLEQAGIPSAGGQSQGGQQPMQVPPQGYAQPMPQQQYAQPQMPPQGYAQPPAQMPPQPGFAPQQPAQPQGSPQGGFLAQIPPQGQGPQGGNQGGGVW